MAQTFGTPKKHSQDKGQRTRTLGSTPGVESIYFGVVFLLLAILLSFTRIRKIPFKIINTITGLFTKGKNGKPGTGLQSIPTATKQEKQTDQEQEKYKEIYLQMVEIIKTRQLFLDPNLTQLDITKYLGTNRNYLHSALKLYANDNFKVFLNKFRVEYAKLLIKKRITSGKDYILSDIFSECGFSTNESFYRTFKKITDLTPGEYAKRIYEDIHNPTLSE